MGTTMTERKLYQVRPGRTLFYRMDMNPETRIWAHAEQYVDATHPVLQGFIDAQAHKVQKVSVVPKGKVFYAVPDNEGIRREMREYDRGAPVPVPIASEDVLAVAEELPSADPEPEPEPEPEDEPEPDPEDEDEETTT